jgi:hypothetical protein
MIYCTERKIGVFLNPKTGSRSILSIFRNNIPPVAWNVRNTCNYTLMKERYSVPEDFDTYKFYAFYRDPVERFIDGYRTYKTLGYGALFIKFFTADDYRSLQREIEKARFDNFIVTSRDPKQQYQWLSKETKEKIETITVKKIFEAYGDDIVNINFFDRQMWNMDVILKENPLLTEENKAKILAARGPIDLTAKIHPIDFVAPAMFIPQTFWLDHSNIDITYLNFHNFESETRKLAAEFGVTLDEVPHKNPTIPIENEIPITQEDIDLIKQHYQRDYDFFASKNITFT